MSDFSVRRLPGLDELTLDGDTGQVSN